MRLAHAAASAVAAAGLAAAVLGAAVGRWRDGLLVTLDLWIGAGLLRLAFDPGLQSIAAAAGVIAVRRLVSAALRSSVVWAEETAP